MAKLVAGEARQASFGDRVIEPRNDQLKALLAYWRQKKGDRRAPTRADIDPAEIKRLLPYVGLVDVERSPLRFRYRLVG